MLYPTHNIVRTAFLGAAAALLILILGCTPQQKQARVDSILHCQAADVQQVDLRATDDSSLVTHTVKVTDRAQIEALCAALNEAHPTDKSQRGMQWMVVVELRTKSGINPAFVAHRSEHHDVGSGISIQSDVTSGWYYGSYRSDALAPILEKMAHEADAYRTPVPEETTAEPPIEFVLFLIYHLAMIGGIILAVRIGREQMRRHLEAEAKSGKAPESFQEIGSASIQNRWMGWWFARLTATRDRLSVRLKGQTREFAPADVVAIEPVVIFPGLRRPLCIVYLWAGHPRFLYFQSLWGADNLLRKIQNVGFVPAGPDNGIRPRQGPAMRVWVPVIPVMIWAAMMFDFSRTHSPGLLSFGVLLATFLLSIGLFWSKRLQRLVMRPGRMIAEVQPWILLIALLTGGALMITISLMSLAWSRPEIMTEPNHPTTTSEQPP